MSKILQLDWITTKFHQAPSWHFACFHAELRPCYKSDHLQADGIKAVQADSLQLGGPQMFLITGPPVDLKEGWIQRCVPAFWLDLILLGGGLSLWAHVWTSNSTLFLRSVLFFEKTKRKKGCFFLSVSPAAQGVALWSAAAAAVWFNLKAPLIGSLLGVKLMAHWGESRTLMLELLWVASASDWRPAQHSDWWS